MIGGSPIKCMPNEVEPIVGKLSLSKENLCSTILGRDHRVHTYTHALIPCIHQLTVLSK